MTLARNNIFWSGKKHLVVGVLFYKNNIKFDFDHTHYPIPITQVGDPPAPLSITIYNSTVQLLTVEQLQTQILIAFQKLKYRCYRSSHRFAWVWNTFTRRTFSIGIWKHKTFCYVKTRRSPRLVTLVSPKYWHLKVKRIQLLGLPVTCLRNFALLNPTTNWATCGH